MEAAASSETLVNIYQTTRHHIPEDSNVHGSLLENIKSRIPLFTYRIWGSHSGDYELSFVFWDITPCVPLKVNKRFGRTCHLHLQGRRISRNKKQNLLTDSWYFLAWHVFVPWRWRRDVTPKYRLIFNELHGIISLKTELIAVYILRADFELKNILIQGRSYKWSVCFLPCTIFLLHQPRGRKDGLCRGQRSVSGRQRT
jgi:hypothetical protein